MALCYYAQGNLWEGNVVTKRKRKYIKKKITNRITEREGKKSEGKDKRKKTK